MAKLKILFCLLVLSSPSFGQEWPEIRRVTDSAEYFAMEPLVDSCISYLQHTTPQDDFNGRMLAVDFLDQWISGVPYLVITQLDYLLRITDENKELTTQHVAGKLHFLRANPAYSEDSYASEKEGLLWMIELYETGMFERTTELDRLVERKNEGTLDEWLKNEVPEDWTTDSD